MKTDSSFFKSPFFMGMSSVINLAGNHFECDNFSTPNQIDSKAIRSDWENVGHDINAGLNEELVNIENTLS